VTIELSHDPAIDLQIEVSDREPVITDERLQDGEDASVRYRFHYANQQPIETDDRPVSMMDIAPYVRISSIPSMLQEARLYQAAANDQEKPSDQIRELADEITQGITVPTTASKTTSFG